MLARKDFTDDESFRKALRDYLAGQALIGLVADPKWKASEVAACAYSIADAMIERKNNG